MYSSSPSIDITSITGIEAFSNLEIIYINSNSISTFNMQSNSNIKFIKISSSYATGQLTNINVFIIF